MRSSTTGASAVGLGLGGIGGTADEHDDAFYQPFFDAQGMSYLGRIGILNLA